MLDEIEADVAQCRICSRLVTHRERVAATKTKRFADEEYWGKAVPSFGDQRARLLIVGLAPADLRDLRKPSDRLATVVADRHTPAVRMDISVCVVLPVVLATT